MSFGAISVIKIDDTVLVLHTLLIDKTLRMKTPLKRGRRIRLVSCSNYTLVVKPVGIFIVFLMFFFSLGTSVYAYMERDKVRDLPWCDCDVAFF